MLWRTKWFYMNDRDVTVLEKILKYIDEINGTVSRFELDFDKFKNDFVMKNAISMCLLQIGELVVNLTDEFKIEHSKMPWREIVAVRNRAAHGYGSIDMEVIWDIVTINIPELKQYCENIMEEKEDYE